MVVLHFIDFLYRTTHTHTHTNTKNNSLNWIFRLFFFSGYILLTRKWRRKIVEGVTGNGHWMLYRHHILFWHHKVMIASFSSCILSVSAFTFFFFFYCCWENRNEHVSVYEINGDLWHDLRVIKIYFISIKVISFVVFFFPCEQSKKIGMQSISTPES